jgi:hypothetical protein
MPQPRWDEDLPQEEVGPVFTDEFPADEDSPRFQRHLRELGRRRKQFAGRRKSSHGKWALGILVGGVSLALVVGAVALLLPAKAAPLRWVLVATCAVILGLAGSVALWRWAKHRAMTRARRAFAFHEGGGVYQDGQHVHVFSWAAVGRVVFFPDSYLGRVSELIISLAPEEPVVSGRAIDLQLLRNALILTSEFFPLAELHQMARRLHALLGELKVVAHPRDRKLYRLD